MLLLERPRLSDVVPELFVELVEDATPLNDDDSVWDKVTVRLSLATTVAALRDDVTELVMETVDDGLMVELGVQEQLASPVLV